MGALRLQIASRSDTGRVRSHNQDALGIDAEKRIAVLADGMGGHRAGEVASRIAVEATLEALRGASIGDGDEWHGMQQVGLAVERANRALLDTCDVHPELSGMGTTVVAVAFRDDRIYHAHVGDSRLYRARLGRLRRLTHDHSLIQQMVDDGVFMNRAAARAAGIRDNVLTRSLGMQRHTQVDVGDALVEGGDTYLVCSDGLHGLVPDVEIARLLREPDGDLEDQAEQLLQAALDAGGIDNVSLILLRPLLD
jgi:protein phosphatase